MKLKVKLGINALLQYPELYLIKSYVNVSKVNE